MRGREKITKSIIFLLLLASQVPLSHVVSFSFDYNANPSLYFPTDGSSVKYQFEIRNGPANESITVRGGRTYEYRLVGGLKLQVTETVRGNITWPRGTGTQHVIHYNRPWEFACQKLEYTTDTSTNATRVVGCWYPKPAWSNRQSSMFKFTYTYFVDLSTRRCVDSPTSSDIVYVTITTYGARSSTLQIGAGCAGAHLSGNFAGFILPREHSVNRIRLGPVKGDCGRGSHYTNAGSGLRPLFGDTIAVTVFSEIESTDTRSRNIFLYFDKQTGVKVAEHQEAISNDRVYCLIDENVVAWSLNLPTVSRSTAQTSTAISTPTSAHFTTTEDRTPASSPLVIQKSIEIISIVALSVVIVLCILYLRRRSHA